MSDAGHDIVAFRGSQRECPVRSRSNWSRVFVPFIVVSVMNGCAASDSATLSEAVRSDSAGVEIVVNTVAGEAAPVFATLDSVPGLRIGATAGRPEEEFGTVTDVVPLSDGGVAVLDGQAVEIRVFDSDGAYRMSLGSEGEGPGEFRQPNRLALLPGDTLAVYDPRTRRITTFGPDGALGRITTLRDVQTWILRASFLPDGRFIGQSVKLAAPDAPIPGAEPTFHRDTVVLTLFSVDGAVEDTIDTLPSREDIVAIERDGRGVSVFKRPAAFARTNVFAGHPEGIWSSQNDRFELRLRSAENGSLIRVVRAPGLERPVTDALASAVADRALTEAETANDRRHLNAWYEQSPRPEKQPAYDLLVVDDVGRLWLHEWSALDLGKRWWVFAANGDLLGSVDVPNEMTIAAVRCGSVWGVERDEWDVSYVVRYALPGPGAC
jgi:6-bladed beta-propeller